MIEKEEKIVRVFNFLAPLSMKKIEDLQKGSYRKSEKTNSGLMLC